MPHPRQSVGKRHDLICCQYHWYAFQNPGSQPFPSVCQGPDTGVAKIKRQAGPVEPLRTPPPKRFRRKGSDATVSRVSLDSQDKLAMSRLDTLEMVSPPKVPTPKKLTLTPEAVVPAKDDKVDTSQSQPSSSFERTRQFLLQKKEARASSASTKAVAKAKASSSKKAPPKKNKKGTSPKRARMTRMKLQKKKTVQILDDEQQPSAATAEESTKPSPKAKAKAKASPAQRASTKASPKASPKAQSRRARDQPATEDAQPAETEDQEEDEEDTTTIDKLAHKLYMRYWRSMNKSRLVHDSFACHYRWFDKYLRAISLKKNDMIIRPNHSKRNQSLAQALQVLHGPKNYIYMCIPVLFHMYVMQLLL